MAALMIMPNPGAQIRLRAEAGGQAQPCRRAAYKQRTAYATLAIARGGGASYTEAPGSGWLNPARNPAIEERDQGLDGVALLKRGLSGCCSWGCKVKKKPVAGRFASRGVAAWLRPARSTQVLVPPPLAPPLECDMSLEWRPPLEARGRSPSRHPRNPFKSILGFGW